jgi:hypothetical protein
MDRAAEREFMKVACRMGGVAGCLEYYNLRPAAAAISTIAGAALIAAGLFFTYAAAKPGALPKLNLGKAGRIGVSLGLTIAGLGVLMSPFIYGSARAVHVAKQDMAEMNRA